MDDSYILRPDVNWEPVCSLDWARLISEDGEGHPVSGEAAVFRPMDEVEHQRCSISCDLGDQARGLYIRSNAKSCEAYCATSSAGPFDYCGGAAGVETTKGCYLIRLPPQVCISRAWSRQQLHWECFKPSL
jgi:hypothetical protein